MKRPSTRRVVRTLAIPALVLAAVALTPLAPSPGGDSSTAAAARWTPMSPVSVTFPQAAAAGPTVTANLLAFNDFHGNIDPPTGSGGLVNGNPAGGVEYLAYWVKRLRAEAQQSTPYVYTVAAGDNIGATPLVSAAFHDEPAIETLNELGLDIASVGNHEFDEGVTELLRMQNGGCHPTDGCQDGDGFDGADFSYLAANVTDKISKLPVLLPFTIRTVGNVPVAFVGMTLEGTPTIVNPAGITTVDFRDEVETANKYADLLGVFGIKSLVLIIHEGGNQQSPPTPQDPSSCANFAGAITPIVAGLKPAYGVVVSGHTHQWYSCALPNASGAPTVVTSAGSAGRLVTKISMTFNKATRQFTAASAQNVIVENGIRNPDGTWQTSAPGVFVRDPNKVDPAVKVIADKYRTAVAPIANRVVGAISADITNTAVASGESPLGDVIADAQLAYTASAGAQLALMNPGGIRASLTYANSPGGEAPGQVTYGECFTVQPFNNLVVTQTFTGAQIKEVLEQQFAGYAGQTTQRILQISSGLTYSYDRTRALGDRILDLKLNGVAIDPATSYRVTTNDFLANGGDGFTKLTLGTNRVTAPGFDVDALVAYLGGPTSPVAPGPANRITRLA
ncbi:MAG TPA: bifunctional metallophosphatase/5'-nucleotidase [Micromonosporaceae bacterium]